MDSFSRSHHRSSRRWSLVGGWVGMAIGLWACQEEVTSGPSSLEVSATVVYTEAWKIPDSLTWSSETVSDRKVDRMELRSRMATGYFQLPVPGTAKVSLSTWKLGMRTAITSFRQNGSAQELVNDTVVRDPVAMALLAELDSNGLRSRDSLYRHYADHLLDGDDAYRGFPATCPKGIDTGSVIRLALALAVAKKSPLAEQSRNWLLAVDTSSLPTRVRELVALGKVKASDTLAAFPPYPVRVLERISVPDLEMGRSVVVRGKFEGDSGIAFYDVRILRNGSDATSAFKFASSIKRIGPTQKTWDLQADAALTISDTGATPGTYTLEVWISDSKGRTDTSRCQFQVFAKAVKFDEPRILLQAPAMNATFPFETPAVEVRWSLKYAGKIDSVLIDGTRTAPIQDSLYVRTIGLQPTGAPKAIPIVVFAGGRIFLDSVVVRRQLAPSVDSTIRLSFLSPGKDTSLDHGTSSLAVVLKAVAALHVDSIVVAGTRLVRGTDSTIWTGTVTGLAVGRTELAATAFAIAGKTGTATRTTTRLPLGAIDSTIGLVFLVPSADTTLVNTATSLSVILKTTAALHVDSVVVAGIRLARGTDSTIWTGTVANLGVGSRELAATAFAVAGKSGASSRRATRLPPGAIDSSIAVVFATPSKDTTVAYATTALPVSIKTASLLRIDSVVVSGTRLAPDRDSTVWTGSVTNLGIVGKTLVATAYAAAGRSGSATRSVTRSAPESIDSSINVAFLGPLKDTTVSNATVSLVVRLKASSLLRIDSVVVSGTKLVRASDSSIWTGTVNPLVVGGNFLVATAYSATRRGLASLGVLRRDIAGAPRFSPAPGTYPSATWVKISDSTPDADLTYSRDGKTWQVYKDSILVEVPETLQVRAGMAGRDSSYATAVFVIQNVAQVRFSPADGRYNSTQTVVLSTTTPDAILEFSRDALTWSAYTAPISVTGSGLLYGRASHPGMVPSLEGARYRIVRAVAKPVFSLASGTYGAPFSLSISDSTPEATIQWSTDSATWNTYTGPISVATSRKFHARATGTDLDTAYASASYVVSTPPPRFSASPGTYAGSLDLTLIEGATGARIRYSTDRLTWTDYLTSLVLKTGATIHAYEVVEGMGPSDTIGGTFEIRTLAPAITPEGGTFAAPPTATLFHGDPGATLYYSFDGSAWTEFSTATPIDVKASGTLYAKAQAPGQVASVVVSRNFTVHDYPKIGNAPGLQVAPINQILSLPLGLQGGKFSPLAVREYRTRATPWTAFAGDALSFKVPWNVDGIDTVVVRVFNANGDGDSIRFPIRSWYLDARDTTYYNRVLLGGNVWMGKDLSFNSSSNNLCENSDNTKCRITGRVYTGNPSTLSICPSGWKLPASSDWRALVTQVSGGASSTSLAASQLKTLQDAASGGTNDFGFSIGPMFSFTGASTGSSWTSGSGVYLSTTTSTGTCSGHTSCSTSMYEGLSVSTTASIATATYLFSYSDYMSGGGGNTFNKARCIEGP